MLQPNIHPLQEDKPKLDLRRFRDFQMDLVKCLDQEVIALPNGYRKTAIAFNQGKIEKLFIEYCTK